MLRFFHCFVSCFLYCLGIRSSLVSEFACLIDSNCVRGYRSSEEGGRPIIQHSIYQNFETKVFILKRLKGNFCIGSAFSMNFDKISSKFNNSPEEIRNQEAEPTDTSRRKAGRRMGKYFSFFGLYIHNL